MVSLRGVLWVKRNLFRIGLGDEMRRIQLVRWLFSYTKDVFDLIMKQLVRPQLHGW